jgi:alkylated DNA nucleotide flippase Atl1
VINGQGTISRRFDPSSMVTQRLRLRREGVAVAGGRVDLERFGWARARARVLIDELPGEAREGHP